MKFTRLALVTTFLAFGVSMLPFKAYIDLPLFYVSSLSSLVLALLGIARAIQEKEGLEHKRIRWIWLSVSILIFVFWTSFWIVSLNRHEG